MVDMRLSICSTRVLFVAGVYDCVNVNSISTLECGGGGRSGGEQECWEDVTLLFPALQRHDAFHFQVN